MKELDAMQTIANALESLNDEEIERVLGWALKKFDIEAREINNEAINENDTQKGTNNYDNIADFYYMVSPSTDAEKALAVGYWLQEIEGSSNFDSYSVNSELKHLGHQVSNITRAFNQLMNKNPQLAIQTKKTGSTKQARKKYKLTIAGVKHIEEILDA